MRLRFRRCGQPALDRRTVAQTRPRRQYRPQGLGLTPFLITVKTGHCHPALTQEGSEVVARRPPSRPLSSGRAPRSRRTSLSLLFVLGRAQILSDHASTVTLNPVAPQSWERGPKMSKDLASKVAVVTGAFKGLGAGIAKRGSGRRIRCRQLFI